jgi:hypothetical protein
MYTFFFLIGFGSTRRQPIQANGVHYDCGCLFTCDGDLIQFPDSKGNGGALSVPSVYIAYFSTFGAMVSPQFFYSFFYKYFLF